MNLDYEKKQFLRLAKSVEQLKQTAKGIVGLRRAKINSKIQVKLGNSISTVGENISKLGTDVSNNETPRGLGGFLKKIGKILSDIGNFLTAVGEKLEEDEENEGKEG